MYMYMHVLSVHMGACVCVNVCVSRMWILYLGMCSFVSLVSSTHMGL